MDAANIDLKGFSNDFYHKLCVGALNPVLDTLKYLKHETDVWFEITTLLIPDQNDSDDELKRMCNWIAEHLGVDVPLHFTAFHPDWKMMDVQSTPSSTLRRARRIGKEAGLHYVYTGNVHDRVGATTLCPACDARLIERDWYEILEYRLSEDGCCIFCGTEIAGHFGPFNGAFGARRIPIKI